MANSRVGDRAAPILITGASGYLGGLVTTHAIAHTDAPLVLPLRDVATRGNLLRSFAAELAAGGHAFGETERARLTFLELPPRDRFPAWAGHLRDLGVRDVLHCAGCSSYFGAEKLQAGNVDLVRSMIELGRALDVRRFVHLSTAFSGGFRDGPIPEELHHDPGPFANDYMRSKHAGEAVVAESGLPWVIVRPSVVIGDSRDGRYSGKPYGVYQLWATGERFYADTFPPVIHVIAADAPVNFVHQDAFAAGWWAAYRDLPDHSIFHLVSRDETLPSMRSLWRLWMDTYGGAREVHFYDDLDQIPVDGIDERERRRLAFTAVNSVIASMRWRFETGHLDRLSSNGLDFVHATLETLERCQRRYVDDVPRIREFVRAYREHGVAQPRYIQHTD